MSVLKLKRYFSFFILLVSFFLNASCFLKKGQQRLLINGAGASFPYILYSKWLSEYRKIDPSVAVNYQSIGSGGGIRQFIAGTLDFGGTDTPVSEEDKKSAKKEILHIPTTLGAVAVTYKLDLDKESVIRMSGSVLSQIYRGKITKWNDPKIQKINSGVKLPEEDIVVVYRADASGTTSFFTEYLALHSKDFLKEVGRGKAVSWPVGVGGKGNEGVMGLVSKIKGSIAYIGASYAASQALPMAYIENSEGRFLKPDLKSIRASASEAVKSNEDHTASFINIKGEKSYPMSGYTYIIISKKLPEKKGKALINFLKWSLGPGQAFAKPLYFIPLPDRVTESAISKLSQVEFE